MAFIRTKKFSRQLYAYVVENTWTPKGPRQKVTRYLGKITPEPSVVQKPFPDVEVGRLSYPDSIRTILIWNLEQMGFSITGEVSTAPPGGISTPKYLWNGITVDTLLFTVKHTDAKDAIIKRDEGYLCGLALQQLVNFTMAGNEENVGYAFARAFVDAGLVVPRDVFVRIFEKVYQAPKE